MKNKTNESIPVEEKLRRLEMKHLRRGLTENRKGYEFPEFQRRINDAIEKIDLNGNREEEIQLALDRIFPVDPRDKEYAHSEITYYLDLGVSSSNLAKQERQL